MPEHGRAPQRTPIGVAPWHGIGLDVLVAGVDREIRRHRITAGHRLGQTVRTATPQRTAMGAEGVDAGAQRRRETGVGVLGIDKRPQDMGQKPVARLVVGEFGLALVHQRDVARHAAGADPPASGIEQRHRRDGHQRQIPSRGLEPVLRVFDPSPADEGRGRRPGLVEFRIRLRKHVDGTLSDEVAHRIAERAARRHEDEHAVRVDLPGEIARDIDQVLVPPARFRQGLVQVVGQRAVAGEEENAIRHRDQRDLHALDGHGAGLQHIEPGKSADRGGEAAQSAGQRLERVQQRRRLVVHVEHMPQRVDEGRRSRVTLAQLRVARLGHGPLGTRWQRCAALFRRHGRRHRMEARLPRGHQE